MDPYSDPFLTEKITSNAKKMSALLDELYEYRDEKGTELMGALLMAKRDEQILHILKLTPSESTPIEIAAIQGKISVISEVVAFINAQYYERSKKHKKVEKPKRARKPRTPTDAGPAI
jgi:hypothetical protein